jgi:hypothetical protein
VVLGFKGLRIEQKGAPNADNTNLETDDSEDKMEMGL